MQLLLKAVLIVLLITPYAIASDKKLETCSAGGYYSGAQDRFMSGIAIHILAKEGLLGTPACSALWNVAYDVGVSYSRDGKFANTTEAEIGKQAENFSQKVYSAVAKNMGF